MTTEPDFSIDNQGTISVLTGLSDKCRIWITQNVQFESYQGSADLGIAIDSRYIDDIETGLKAQGFTK